MQLQAKYVILGLLRKRAMSGYEIKKNFEGPFSFFFDASYGSIYPTLTKLEQEGLISKTTIRQEDRPNKHEYALTAEGQRMLARYLESELLADSIRSDLCMKLYFGEFASESLVLEWVEAGLRRSEAALDQLRQMEQEYGSEMTRTQRLSLEIGIQYHQGRYDTLREGARSLRGGNEANGEGGPLE